MVYLSYLGGFMKFKEFGDKNKPAIVLLHGGGLSWWSYKKGFNISISDGVERKKL